MVEKMERLQAMAEDDEAYRQWSKVYAEAQAEFDNYANTQPEEIQNILRGYAEGGRLRYQRLVNLACMYMDFTD